jgi:hypothetical protein
MQPERASAVSLVPVNAESRWSEGVTLLPSRQSSVDVPSRRSSALARREAPRCRPVTIPDGGRERTSRPALRIVESEDVLIPTPPEGLNRALQAYRQTMFITSVYRARTVHFVDTYA